MNDWMFNRLQLQLLAAMVVWLTSCEGATYLNHQFTNETADTLQIGLRSDESATGWTLDTTWTLVPGETRAHYALDMWGKCTIALLTKQFRTELILYGFLDKP